MRKGHLPFLAATLAADKMAAATALGAGIDRPAAMPLETKVDALQSRVRAKLESMTGFGDEATQAHQLNKLFR